MAIDTASPLTLSSLEDHLLRSADLFRNKISNQKDYILPLLFFKRASDHFQEEQAQALDELDGVPQDAALKIIEGNPAMYHSVIVPAGHFWDDVRKAPQGQQGKALNDALREIGRANPTQLSGVFENLDFNNKTALQPEDLKSILDHFNDLGPLTDDRVTPDMLGQAYEWLIAKFAANAGKGGGEFYTPAAVGKLGARLLQPGPNDEAYDPTCGSGGLLLQVLDEAHHVHGEAARGFAIYGQELNPETWAIARMNMLLHGASGAASIERGDTLKEPKFLHGEALRLFPLIIANPPFSPKNWGHDWLKKHGDPYGRITQLPSKDHGEIAFVQHMTASLTDTGRMAVVQPNGVFFRAGAELELRKELLSQDIVEAVIQMPKDMFYGAGIAACYLMINKAKPVSRQGKVLFIDASECFERIDKRNIIRDEHIDRIVSAYRSDDEEEGFAAFASLDEIAARRFSLTVRRYVRGLAGDAAVSYEDALSAYTEAVQARDEAHAAAQQVLQEIQAEASQ